jgi:hypothetical protein
MLAAKENNCLKKQITQHKKLTIRETIKLCGRFAALKNLDDDDDYEDGDEDTNDGDDSDIVRAWVSIKETIKASATELKLRKSWFDEECSKLLDPRNRAKLQWLQNPTQINGHNLKNVRCESSRTFRNKWRECLQ